MDIGMIVSILVIGVLCAVLLTRPFRENRKKDEPDFSFQSVNHENPKRLKNELQTLAMDFELGKMVEAEYIAQRSEIEKRLQIADAADREDNTRQDAV